MHLLCASCGRRLEFSGEQPSFCGFCGKSLSPEPAQTTDHFDPDATGALEPSSAKQAPAPPSTLGGYRILKRLGGGGMGAVYEAEGASSGQRVAVKMISPDHAASAVAMERFRQEGRLASLIEHPRCVFVLAAEEEANQPYIVMELISGTTLQALVDKNGPLSIQDALAKILDVIEGLQEAHRLGVVHRDVKPSNCFLLEDGRVKIGDFGLSKSLVSTADLTKTGSFIGTFLYASPEQIKGERVDFRTDVYSVAATLYFLLSRQAPFAAKDAAATLARTVSEPPTPLRSLRPDVPPALEKVIRRGLERDLAKRWKSLDDFRAALSRFVPVRPSIGALGLRAGAIILDHALYMPLAGLITFAVIVGVARWRDAPSWNPWLSFLIPYVCLISYFAVAEWLWGATPGKWLLRLRVRSANGYDPAGFGRLLYRSFLYWLIADNVSLLGETADLLGLTHASSDGALGSLRAALGILALPIGILLFLSTMRARNGYRGPHEFLSGTRVVQLPWPKRSRAFDTQNRDRLTEELASPKGLPSSIGSFQVVGMVHQQADAQLLLGEDPTLARKVLISLRPLSASPVPPTRRNLHRPTRLRWLAGGQLEDSSWDAFLAPVGCPLADLCSPKTRMTWRDFRGILEQLTDELDAACADDTLPVLLTVDQVWVQPSGRIQVLDVPLLPAVDEYQSRKDGIPQERALGILREAARLALEGRLRSPNEAPGPAKAPVPEHANEMLQRLGGGPIAYESVAQLRTDLTLSRDRMTEVRPQVRAVQLLLKSLVIGPLLLSMFVVPLIVLGFRYREQLTADSGSVDPSLVALALWAVGQAPNTLILIIWAFLFRGGVTLSMMGLTLVCSDGSKASRLRCALRACVALLPLSLLLLLSLIVMAVFRESSIFALAAWCLALTYIVSCIVLALVFPNRTWYDRVVGTYLVPK
jgi:serine/threonine protein kinase